MHFIRCLYATVAKIEPSNLDDIIKEEVGKKSHIIISCEGIFESDFVLTSKAPLMRVTISQYLMYNFTRF